MKNSIVNGAQFIAEGFNIILLPRIRLFVLVPLAINILLFTGAIVWAFVSFDSWINSFLPSLDSLPSWLSFLKTALDFVISYILWPIFALVIFILIFYTFTIISNLVAAPFNGLLAEAVEKHLTNQPLPEFSFKETLRTLPKMIGAEIRKLLYLVGWAIPIFLVTFFIPGMQLLAPLLWFIYSAWMMSIEYADYPMGNHQILFAQQREKLREQRWNSLGFGGGVTVLTMIPIINFIAMPTAVAGATAYWVRQFKPE